MTLDGYKKDLEGRVAEMKSHLKWLVDNNVITRQKRENDVDWVDTTQSTRKQYEENIASLERLIEAIEKREI